MGVRRDRCGRSAPLHRPEHHAPAAGTRLVVAAHLQVEDVAGGWEAHVADGSAGLALNVLNANSGVGIATALQRTIGIRRTDTAAVYDIGPVVFPFDMPPASRR